MIDAPPPYVQHVLDSASVYLERIGLGLPRHAVVEGLEGEPYGGVNAEAAVVAQTGKVRLTPATAQGFETLWLARRLEGSSIDPQAARVALHELVHVYAPSAPEGPVDAVAADHTMDFADRYTGRRWVRVYVVPSYRAEVDQVREVSAAACESGWRSKCARAAREAILRWEAVRG